MVELENNEKYSCVAGASKYGTIKNVRARRYACLSRAPHSFFGADHFQVHDKTWSPNRNKINMAESMMDDFIAKRIHHRTSYAWKCCYNAHLSN